MITATDRGTRRVVAVDADGERHELWITPTGPATVADLIGALSETLGGRWPDRLFVNGQGFPTTMALSDVPLADGTELTADAPTPPPSGIIVELRAVAGVSAGTVLRFTPGRFALGRLHRSGSLTIGAAGGVELFPDPGRGIRVSGRLVTEPTPLAIGDTIEIESTAYTVSPPTTGASRSARFNRPPRTLPPPDPPPLDPPTRATISSQAPPFRWPMLLAPLVMGVAMVIIFQRLAFLIFIAIGPLMMLANWIDGRLRRRKGSRRAEAAFRKALAGFRHDLDDWRGAHHDAARRRHPPLPETVRRAVEGDARLWERRLHHPDFLRLFAGYGPAPLTSPASGALEPEIEELLRAPDRRGAFPIELDLLNLPVVGLVGPPEATRAVTRALAIQAAVHHGPSDLGMAVVCRPADAAGWGFLGWLPHTENDQARRMLAAGPEDAAAVLADVAASERHTLLILDGTYSPEQAAWLNELTATRPVSVIVMAPQTSALPGATALTIATRPGGRLLVTETATGATATDITAVMAPHDVAADVARSLAAVTDPERSTIAAHLAERVSLLDLMDMPDPTADLIRRRWERSGSTVRAPIGQTASGVLEIDLVRDGPHALLGGTTGSGKSELLRTLVASLAATVDPEHLNFVLIDYKGGSAFDVCADLPHVVGLVTDLDPTLAQRAVTCLEAELTYREHRLRDAGVSDLSAHLARGTDDDPLPRLFIVIDEFAAMAKELPEFMSALVDIAARGRSLGVHLMLATQRPAGVIGDNIRANTNLRLALRVQSTTDSKDVLDDTAAAGLPRSLPGRGYARFGPSELVGFQTALISGAAGFAEAGVQVDRVRFDPRGPAIPTRIIPEGVATDLERLVAAISEAAMATGMRPGRTPWPPPLNGDLPLHRLLPGEPLTLGLADEPRRQRHVPVVWDPSVSALGLYGLAGAGPEAAVETAIRSIAATWTQAEAEIFIATFGTHDYSSVSSLPHTAPIVDADDLEGQIQLLRFLRREFDARRKEPARKHPRLFVAVDDIGAFRDAFDSVHLSRHFEVMSDLIGKGPALGLHLIATMHRPNALPMKLTGSISTRFVFRFPDMSQAMALGVDRSVAVDDLPFAGFVDTRTGLVGQIAVGHEGVPVRVDERAATPQVPMLPSFVSAADLPPAEVLGEQLWVPIGIGESSMEPCGLALGPGEHVLVTSPARGGRSTVLREMALRLASATDLQLVAVTPRRSPLAGAGVFKYVVDDVDQVDALAAALADTDQEQIAVFVDDAELVQSTGMERLLTARRDNVRVIASMRNEEATRSYAHWTRRLRDSRKGVALQPTTGIAEMYGHQFPKAMTPRSLGRGFLIDGHVVEYLQAGASREDENG